MRTSHRIVRINNNSLHGTVYFFFLFILVYIASFRLVLELFFFIFWARSRPRATNAMHTHTRCDFIICSFILFSFYLSYLMLIRLWQYRKLSTLLLRNVRRVNHLSFDDRASIYCWACCASPPPPPHHFFAVCALDHACRATMIIIIITDQTGLFFLSNHKK